MNQPKKTKSKSDSASKTIIDLDSSNTIDTIDLTEQYPLRTLSSQESNVLEANASNISSQKQIVLSGFLINQKLLLSINDLYILDQ